MAEECTTCGVAHEVPDAHDFKYVDDNVDEELLDPISLTPIVDGVLFPTTSCEHTFSRSTIQRALQQRPNVRS